MRQGLHSLTGSPPCLLCEAAFTPLQEKVEKITTASGLQYKDIIVGTGPQPELGFQVC